MPRGHSLSIYARFWGKKRTSLYISREKDDHYFIQTRPNDLFSHYNLFLRKRKEKNEYWECEKMFVKCLAILPFWWRCHLGASIKFTWCFEVQPDVSLKKKRKKKKQTQTDKNSAIMTKSKIINIIKKNTRFRGQWGVRLRELKTTANI